MAGGFAPIDAADANTIKSSNKKKVAYFYDSDIGNFAYNAGHPMKPHRIRMAHSLVMNYGLYKHMEIYRAKPATAQEMTQFHTDDYVSFLQDITPDKIGQQEEKAGRFNVGDDCPVFDGLFEFCGISAGGSMEGAARLNRKKCDVAVNWAGGLHHAKKAEASGFCYINDIVLGILELLRFHKKVLYIDIDVHHGDGVEEAFYSTNRVMTVSLHKYGEYFPGTGELRDVGIGEGTNHSVNFPLRDGIDDAGYKTIFERVIKGVMEYYQPDAIVLQCGGDSLSGDRLGCFNLSMRGHAHCVRYVKSFNKPTMILGGGGYTMRNVARTWAYETGLLLDQEQNMAADLPFTDYYEYYAPDFELDVKPSNMDNANSAPYLTNIANRIIANLRETATGTPSVQHLALPTGGDMMSSETMDERDSRENDEDADKEANKDVRQTQRQRDLQIDDPNDMDADDDEPYNESLGVKRQPGAEKKKPSIMAPLLHNRRDTPEASLADGPIDEDVPDIPASAVAKTNAAVAQDVIAAKAAGDLAPSNAPTENGTTVAQADPKEAQDDSMDIDQAPEASNGTQLAPPTDATNDTKPPATSNGDVEMTDAEAQAREKGMLERDKANVDAEVATEIAGGNNGATTGDEPVV